MSTVVAGYIDNPEGRRALDLAIEEASRRQARLIVVHSLRGGMRTKDETYRQYQKALEEVSEELDERERLRVVIKKLRPEGFGVIVRTAAEGATEEDLAADIDRLVEKKLKERLANEHAHAMGDYTDAKTEFIRSIERAAAAELGDGSTE